MFINFRPNGGNVSLMCSPNESSQGGAHDDAAVAIENQALDSLCDLSTHPVVGKSWEVSLGLHIQIHSQIIYLTRGPPESKKFR